MASKPTVLVLSNTNTKPKSIIKLITKSSFKNDSSGNIEHLWRIDTKYYVTEVNLVGLEKDFERNDEFNESVEGVIIHLDTNKSTGLSELKTWENIDEQCDPAVKILLANYCNDNTKIQQSEIVEWCIEHGYEFVELYPDADKVEQDEKVGVERVIEALHSHTWSNLEMKPGGEMTDDFTEMFSQLQLMRESLCSLPSSQRKQCAEQMVTAFWKAIGGDEEEISDL